MKLEEAAKLYSEKLNEKFKTGTFTVGTDQIDTIYIYEHVRGLKMYQRISEFEGSKVISKYIGKVKPC